MDIKMDLSEILLYLELINKEKKKPTIRQLKIMLYFLENYEQVKQFYYKLIEEFDMNIQFKFSTGSLIYFMEDYEDCIDLKDRILKISPRKYSSLFKQQIRLSKNKEQAMNIIKEAKEYGIELGEEWMDRYDSTGRIREKQNEWRQKIRIDECEHFTKLYDEFCKKKRIYFNELSLKELKQILMEQQAKENNTRKQTQTSVFSRSVYVKEFARKVSNGICQLCDREAPFPDKQGNPFLEVHHIYYLSEGGSDSIDNVVALCPNCHRKIHQLELEEDNKKIKERALANLNIDSDLDI